MPYELLLTERVAVTGADRYFDPCCIGLCERLTGWAEQGPMTHPVDGDYNPMQAEG